MFTRPLRSHGVVISQNSGMLWGADHITDTWDVTDPVDGYGGAVDSRWLYHRSTSWVETTMI